MLRVAIPYGTWSPRSRFANSRTIARTYDRGYAHFTTRQNIQYNWIKLEETPRTFWPNLPTVEMHAHPDQRQKASAMSRPINMPAPAADEIVDPRPWAEL